MLPSNESSHEFLSHCFILLPWFFTNQNTLDLHPPPASLFTPCPGSASFSNLSFSETGPDPIRASFRSRFINFKISFSLASSLAFTVSISHCTVQTRYRSFQLAESRPGIVGFRHILSELVIKELQFICLEMLHSFELLNGVPDLERRLATHITGDKTLLIEHENDGLSLLVSSETASESSAKTSVGFDRSS